MYLNLELPCCWRRLSTFMFLIAPTQQLVKFSFSVTSNSGRVDFSLLKIPFLFEALWGNWQQKFKNLSSCMIADRHALRLDGLGYDCWWCALSSSMLRSLRWQITGFCFTGPCEPWQVHYSGCLSVKWEPKESENPGCFPNKLCNCRSTSLSWHNWPQFLSMCWPALDQSAAVFHVLSYHYQTLKHSKLAASGNLHVLCTIIALQDKKSIIGKIYVVYGYRKSSV